MPKLQKPAKPPPETVVEALERFWKGSGSGSGHTPDYEGFMNWIGVKVDESRSVPVLPIHARTELPSEVQLNLELVAAAKHAGIEITKDGASAIPARFGKSDGRPNLKALNRGKLLLMYFKGMSSRQLEMLLMMATPSAQPPTVTSSSSQLQHRTAFFPRSSRRRPAHGCKNAGPSA